MKILILTQYYPPETGAPQNRLSSLAYHLKRLGHEVEVLTAFPNYPAYKIHPDYRDKKKKIEYIDGIKIIRSSLFISENKSVIFRLLTYFSFAFTSYFTGRRKATTREIIICESPPLFLGITAIALKRKWKSKLVFNVSDLWPESAEELGIIKNRFLLDLSQNLAIRIYKNADLISGQTKGIVDRIKQLVPEKTITWLPNGIDDKKFENFEKSIFKPEENGKFHLLYAGILGHAQGLEVILKAAASLGHVPEIHFYIAGDGPEKEKLVRLNKKLGTENLTFLGNLPVELLTQQLIRTNASIIPLKNLPLFNGAIPSKIFEPLFFGKPVLLGLNGEAKELFIDEGKAGLHFEPENHHDLASKILKLYNNRGLANELGSNGREFVQTKFNRSQIAKKFEEHLQKLV